LTTGAISRLQKKRCARTETSLVLWEENPQKKMKTASRRGKESKSGEAETDKKSREGYLKKNCLERKRLPCITSNAIPSKKGYL